MLKPLRIGTRTDKAGAVDGLNLFFGALLGANLGTLDALKLVHYLQMIGVLAGTVMVLRMVSTSSNRRRSLLMLGFYLVLLIVFASQPGFRPESLDPDAFRRLAATMAVWVGLALFIELTPAKEEAQAPTPAA
jgi:hypothetical protein